ncbi:MAG: VF530 family protein [Methylotenera sp.]|nr:VF530 family protein [Methylotenera sp.]
MPQTSTSQNQHNNPLHGITLDAVVTALEANFGWAELAARIPVRCFSNDPSIASSLKFLRKTPWARDKVEALYLLMLHDTNQAKTS